MKNIHVLPTDKPSRIRIGNNGNFVIGLTQSATASKNDSYTNQNIYITSPNEDINENEYIITKDGRLVQVSYLLSKDLEGASKVVLATDQDLIKDGVQAIDDEFLEWFVKNPNCEEVEVGIEIWNDGTFSYRIIIPKEEPKQETLEEVAFQKRKELGLKGTIDGFIAGAKWQAEIMYSEDEVLKFTQTIIQQYKFGNTNVEQMDLLKETLQQFKNK